MKKRLVGGISKTHRCSKHLSCIYQQHKLLHTSLHLPSNPLIAYAATSVSDGVITKSFLSVKRSCVQVHVFCCFMKRAWIVLLWWPHKVRAVTKTWCALKLSMGTNSTTISTQRRHVNGGFQEGSLDFILKQKLTILTWESLELLD